MGFLDFLPVIGKLLDRILPDPAVADQAKYNLLQLQQQGALAELQADLQLALGQIEVNKAEAQSPDFFRSGWRPAVGWTCTLGLAYQFLLQPVLSWLASVKSFPVPPSLDLGTLMTLLFGMLGLGAYRTKEKIEGVA